MTDNFIDKLDQLGIRSREYELSNGYRIDIGNYRGLKSTGLYVCRPNDNVFEKVGNITNLKLLLEALKNDR